MLRLILASCKGDLKRPPLPIFPPKAAAGGKSKGLRKSSPMIYRRAFRQVDCARFTGKIYGLAFPRRENLRFIGVSHPLARPGRKPFDRLRAGYLPVMVSLSNHRGPCTQTFLNSL